MILASIGSRSAQPDPTTCNVNERFVPQNVRLTSKPNGFEDSAWMFLNNVILHRFRRIEFIVASGTKSHFTHAIS